MFCYTENYRFEIPIMKKIVKKKKKIIVLFVPQY